MDVLAERMKARDPEKNENYNFLLLSKLNRLILMQSTRERK